LGKPETFDFLGFTHFCSRSKNGMFEVGWVTISKRIRATLKEIRAQLHKRRHESVQVIRQWLSRLFRGYCNYYHVPGNRRRLDTFAVKLSAHGGMLLNGGVSDTV
jgi:RNA-directed DNA polymerase